MLEIESYGGSTLFPFFFLCFFRTFFDSRTRGSFIFSAFGCEEDITKGKEVIPFEETGIYEIYNEKMRNVPNAAHFTDRDSRDMLKGQCGYVVMQQNKMIGIGIAADNTVEMLASLERGKGSDVLSALAMRLCSEQVRVIVASANLKAMALYERLGFKTINVIGRWFKIV